MDSIVRIEPTPALGMRRFRAGVIAFLCVIYLLNLTGGWVEIPDCLPIIGNLDEAAATVMLLRCLRELGVGV